MRVCLQLMMQQINSLQLDQLTTLAHGLGGLNATKQTRILTEAVVILCNTRGDQLPMLSAELKIYLLEEFGSRLQYSDELLESLWGDRHDIHKWQQAVGFFVALAKASKSTDIVDCSRGSPRHRFLEEWCLHILQRQHMWLKVDDVEALLGALALLDIYDGELFRTLGDLTRESSNLESCVSVWNCLADADFMHIGLMESVLTELRADDIRHMSVDTQRSLLALLAEAANYYRDTTADGEQLSHQRFGDTITACVEELGRTRQIWENVPSGIWFDMCDQTFTVCVIFILSFYIVYFLLLN